MHSKKNQGLCSVSLLLQLQGVLYARTSHLRLSSHLIATGGMQKTWNCSHQVFWLPTLHGLELCNIAEGILILVVSLSSH